MTPKYKKPLYRENLLNSANKVKTHILTAALLHSRLIPNILQKLRDDFLLTFCFMCAQAFVDYTKCKRILAKILMDM